MIGRDYSDTKGLRFETSPLTLPHAGYSNTYKAVNIDDQGIIHFKYARMQTQVLLNLFLRGGAACTEVKAAIS